MKTLAQTKIDHYGKNRVVPKRRRSFYRRSNLGYKFRRQMEAQQAKTMISHIYETII